MHAQSPDKDGLCVKPAECSCIAETERYVILVLSQAYAQAVDQEGMRGGSVEKFCAFSTEKTGKPVVYRK